MEGGRVSHTIRIILALHEAGGCSTVNELIKRLGLKRNYIHSYISYLRRKGVLGVRVVDGVYYYCLEGTSKTPGF